MDRGREVILAQRSQVPITFNQVKPTVDWVLGTEKKIRVDYRVLPRGEEDAKGAEMKTKLFKYVSDTNNAGFKRSKSFADAVLAGVGWIDHGINRTRTTKSWSFHTRTGGISGRIRWRLEDDLSDARYIFRGKWVDEDVACAMFPDRADVIHASVISADQGFGYESFRRCLTQPLTRRWLAGWPTAVRWGSHRSTRGSLVTSACRHRYTRGIVCSWSSVSIEFPAKKKLLRGKELGSLQGVTFDDGKSINELVELGIGQPVESAQMEMRQMIFTGDSVLQDGESPYRHKRFSLVPIWGFKRKKDGTPYGIVRNLRDPQKDLNKRRSKALYLLSANRVMADDDAIERHGPELDDIVQEANRPDGLIKVNPKSQRGVEIQNETRLADRARCPHDPG